VENTLLNKIYAVAGLALSFVATAFAFAFAPRYGLGAGALEILLFVVMYSVSMLGMTVGYHRFFSHRPFEAHPAVVAGLAIAGGMAAQGPVIYWAANHRVHHRYTDAPGDVHSPYFLRNERMGFWRGMWHAQMGWLYRHDIPDAVTYARDWLRSSLVRRLNSMYLVWVGLGLFIPALVDGLVTQSVAGALRGLLWGGFVRLFVAYEMGLSLGSLCHYFGGRPFNIRGRATNNALLALQTFGEGWHNNHHAFPSAAIFQFRWWQLDLGGLLIRALEAPGFIWNVKMPKKEAIRARRAEPDEEDWWHALERRTSLRERNVGPSGD
jgi:stearoyl-CoA desaturase (Delta-9 desaturase)